MTAQDRPAEGPPTDVFWLLGLLICAGLAFAFYRLADEVMEGDTVAFDRAVFLFFRDPADPNRLLGPAWLPEMLRDLTSLGSAVILTLIVAASVGYLMMRRKRFAAVAVLVSVLGGQLISTLLKLAFERPRPDLIEGAPMVFSASFPSGHAMLSAVTYLTLGGLLARFENNRALQRYFLILATALTLIVGISRVLIGVHWPTDVLAGWALGAAWALACSLLWTQIGKRRGWSMSG